MTTNMPSATSTTIVWGVRYAMIEGDSVYRVAAEYVDAEDLP